jgi:hypothetical protein
MQDLDLQDLLRALLLQDLVEQTLAAAVAAVQVQTVFVSSDI